MQSDNGLQRHLKQAGENWDEHIKLQLHPNTKNVQLILSHTHTHTHLFRCLVFSLVLLLQAPRSGNTFLSAKQRQWLKSEFALLNKRLILLPFWSVSLNRWASRARRFIKAGSLVIANVLIPLNSSLTEDGCVCVCVCVCVCLSHQTEKYSN